MGYCWRSQYYADLVPELVLKCGRFLASVLRALDFASSIEWAGEPSHRGNPTRCLTPFCSCTCTVKRVKHGRVGWPGSGPRCRRAASARDARRRRATGQTVRTPPASSRRRASPTGCLRAVVAGANGACRDAAARSEPGQVVPRPPRCVCQLKNGSDDLLVSTGRGRVSGPVDRRAGGAGVGK